MKEVLIALLPVLGGVIPAYLLYRQAKESAERELSDRKSERAAEEKRRQDDFERERIRVQTEGRSAEREARRERVARFLRIVQRIETGAHDASLAGMAYPVPPEERTELAHAYEDLMLDAASSMAIYLEASQECLEALLAAVRRGGPAPGVSARHELKAQIRGVRAAAAAYIDGSQD